MGVCCHADCGDCFDWHTDVIFCISLGICEFKTISCVYVLTDVYTGKCYGDNPYVLSYIRINAINGRIGEIM